ncbi:MAG: sodium:solute symporter family protein [Planctomycetales bacterium]|nr:sodium:solute symporter family protein [Planctomycetales bacterium]
MTELTLVDKVVVVAYLLGVTALGAWAARRVKDSSDFFMPRRFGKGMMIFNAFGTGTAADQAVPVASTTFQHGLSGIWWQWLWLPATPFYWLIAPVMRRLRATTTADAYTLRYDRSVGALFALVGIVGLSVKIGLMLKGAGALIESSTGGAYSADRSILVITVLFVIYGTAGGLAAAIITDYVQGILTLVFSFILLPFVLHAVGGLAGAKETIGDPQMLRLMVPGEIGPFFVAMYALQALIGIVAQPFIMGVCASGRTEMDGRVGFMVGNLVKRLCTMAWCLTALAAVAWYMQSGVDIESVKPDHVYGDVANAFLPKVMPGLLGVFMAALLASTMSSCDAFMISSSGLFTTNIYRPLAPQRGEKHYLLVGRVASLLVVVGGLLFAYWVPDVKEALNIWLRIAPMMGIAFWLGLFWRRTTVAGAWAATVTGFAAWWAATQSWFIEWAAQLPFAESLTLMSTAVDKPELRQPWVILFYTVASLAAGIVVSLLTQPVADEKLERFYGLIRTPVANDEPPAHDCRLPAGVEPALRRLLVGFGGLEILRPSPTSIAGFVAGCVAVFALVAGFWWIVM